MSQDNPIGNALAAAMAVSGSGDAEAALKLYEQACNDQPGFAPAHFLRAAELAQAGQYAEAEAAYATAVLLAPDLHIARFELGVLQFTSSRASMALLTWEPLLRLPDDHFLKLFVQGYVGLAQDQFDAALAWFKQGMAANTENAPLNGNIALLIEGIGKANDVAEPTAAPAQEEVLRFLETYERGQEPLH